MFPRITTKKSSVWFAAKLWHCHTYFHQGIYAMVYFHLLVLLVRNFLNGDTFTSCKMNFCPLGNSYELQQWGCSFTAQIALSPQLHARIWAQLLIDLKNCEWDKGKVFTAQPACPYLSVRFQRSTLFKGEKLKIDWPPCATITPYRRVPLQSGMFVDAVVWVVRIRLFGQRSGGYLAIWCLFSVTRDTGDASVLWVWPRETWRTAEYLESWRCLLSLQAVTPGNVWKDSKRRICGQRDRKFLAPSSHPF